MDYAGELSANSSTVGRISVGGTATSQIETANDRDWFRISLKAGVRYEFDLEGVGGSAELSDPYLRLYKNGSLVAFDDDGGLGLDSRIEFTAGSAGTYFLAAGGYSSRTGEYRLSATEVAPPEEGGSILPAIDWGSAVEPRRIDVYFAAEDERFAGYTSDGWSSYEIRQAMAVFAEIESTINVRFVRTTVEANAEFKLVVSDSEFFDGLMYPQGESNAGVGVFARSASGWDTNGGLEKGGAGFSLLLHELGHGLGLAHPHDTGGDSVIMQGVSLSRGDYGDFDLNQAVFTVMSYNDGFQSETGNVVSSRYGHTSTLSPLDIALLQQRYGAEDTNRAGSTTYTLKDANAKGTSYVAIWDTAGTDSIAYGGARDATIDLRAATLVYENGGGGFVSHVEGIYGGYTIANGVVIEKAQGGLGNDTIRGNDAANSLRGGSGNDRLIAYGDDDMVYGQGGNDRLFGGSGQDRLFGGGGDDFLDVGVGEGNSVQFAYGHNGDDTYVFGNHTGNLFLNFRAETSAGGTDTIVFEDFAVSDLSAAVSEYSNENGMALELSWSDGADSAFLRLANLGENFEKFEFGDDLYDSILSADGSGEARQNSSDWTITRGSGTDDILLGGSGRDSLYGGAGDDFLMVAGRDGDSIQYAFGQGGDDTYSYAKESGNLFINASAETETSGTDTLIFEDLLLADVTAGTVEYNNANGSVLKLSWDDGTSQGSVLIADDGKNIEIYEFENGQTVDFDFFA